MSRPLARLGLAGLQRTRAPITARVGVMLSRAYATPTPTPAPRKNGEVDYSNGPSALDKASQLFFFTEIARGECGA